MIEDNEDKSNKLIDVVSPATLATYNCKIALFKKSKQYRQQKKLRNVEEQQLSLELHQARSLPSRLTTEHIHMDKVCWRLYMM